MVNGLGGMRMEKIIMYKLTVKKKKMVNGLGGLRMDRRV